jgi:glyoxylase-like metal-dependent hydrolase (beta-lactamase superfamily II)
MQFGDVQLFLISGGRFRLDGGAMFGVVPKALWERKFPADDRNRVGLDTNCLLVRAPDYTALIDAGIGERWDEKAREIYGIEAGPSLADGLAARGVAPEDVDAVVLSHLHFDHAGGATRESSGSLRRVFPNATLYVQRSELDHARAPNERDRASYRPADWEPYAVAGRLEVVEGAAEIRPGLRVSPLPGHSSGMQSVRVDSQGRTAFFFADAVPTSAHLPAAWIMAYDLYPVELLESKKRLLDRAVAEKWLAIFYHDPDVPWGRIVDEVDGKRRVHVVARERDAI